MATTYAAFVNALEAMSVTGVNRAYTSGPPASVNDLPAMWVQLPSGSEPALAKGTNWPTLRAEVVIAYEATGQGTPGQNFDGTVGQMDNLVTALRSLSTGKRQPSWEIRVGVVAVGAQEYWSVIATVETEG